MQVFKLQAPGKIILSGEHSVVYGAPALAMAINRYSTVNVNQTDSNSKDIFLEFSDLNYQRSMSLLELESLLSQIEDKYEKFLQKNLNINEVLQYPFELALSAIACFFARFGVKVVAENLSLRVKSSIPSGSGMGSSAAIIVSILYALAALFKVKLEDKDIWKLALKIESLQHGYSSGLDLLVAQRGGCVLLTEGTVKIRKIPKLPMRFIYTGAPQATTGECVEHVTQYFVHGGELAKDFAAVTYALDVALQACDVVETRRCIKENNRLLRYIGIVPPKVQDFIKKLEQRGLAAKVCGAGACKGSAAGVLLVMGEGSDGNIDDVVEDYGYRCLSIIGESRGAQVL